MKKITKKRQQQLLNMEIRRREKLNKQKTAKAQWRKKKLGKEKQEQCMTVQWKEGVEMVNTAESVILTSSGLSKATCQVLQGGGRHQAQPF